MTDQGKEQIRRHVYRPAASATWTHSHKWGVRLGDSTDLTVTRTDGGGLRIAYGKESIEIREALVGVVAEMVAAAATWTDGQVIPPGQSAER